MLCLWSRRSRRFEISQYLYLQNQAFLLDCSDLNFKALGSFETSGTAGPKTQRHIAIDAVYSTVGKGVQLSCAWISGSTYITRFEGKLYQLCPNIEVQFLQIPNPPVINRSVFGSYQLVSTLSQYRSLVSSNSKFPSNQQVCFRQFVCL